MAVRSKVDHTKNISSKKSLGGMGSVRPGDLVSFKYKGKDIYDKTPLIMVLHKEWKIIHGVNINYLKEFIVGRLLEETNFKNLKWYSLYTKAFRTYSKSKMSMMNRVTWKKSGVSSDAQDILDDVMGG